MIVFELRCSADHRFEGWFRSTEAYLQQRNEGLLDCPQCGCRAVGKAPMAPAIAPKEDCSSARRAPAISNAAPSAERPSVPEHLAPEVAVVLSRLAAVQAKALASSKWVGDKFAEQSRAIHYGEAENEQIHGRATKDDAIELMEEGIAVLPLLIPVAPPDEIN